jgi:hypothetical protein
MGAGVTSYFKMLKFFMIMYFWFMFLSIPTYYFYGTGNQTTTNDGSLKYALSALSLGNLG